MPAERAPRETGAKHWEKARVEDRCIVTFPHWGYLHGFEVRFNESQPNMAVNNGPWRAIVEIIGPNGERPPFEVIGVFGNVD